GGTRRVSLWSDPKTFPEQIPEGGCYEAETWVVKPKNPRAFRPRWMSTAHSLINQGDSRGDISSIWSV
ncbi:MAG: hypothetical protein ACM37W_09720, partial [Actinomycetota bacterium]